MRTTLDLPDDLFRQVKAKAALEGATLKAMFTRYVESGCVTFDQGFSRFKGLELLVLKPEG